MHLYLCLVPLRHKHGHQNSFRHTWITFALERGVPIATVCNNCDTSIEYIQQHYFHYDEKRATGALATGRRGLNSASTNG